MDKPTSAAIIIAVIVLALGLMALGWRNRRKRQSGVPALNAVPADFQPAFQVDGLYVSTTIAGEPLERIAVHGLGFRSQSTISVGSLGMAFTIRGADDKFIPAGQLESAGRATWTIDRVVESGGLVVVTWTVGDIHLDSYFRVSDSDELLAAITPLIPLTTESEAQ